MSNLNSADFTTPNSHQDFDVKIEMLLDFQNKTDIKIIGFWLIRFGFALDSSDLDLWNIDLLDTHLDLLDADILSKHFVCLQDVLKTISRHVFKTSSRHVFKTSTRHVWDSSLQYIMTTIVYIWLKFKVRETKIIIMTTNTFWQVISFMKVYSSSIIP